MFFFTLLELGKVLEMGKKQGKMGNITLCIHVLQVPSSRSFFLYREINVDSLSIKTLMHKYHNPETVEAVKKIRKQMQVNQKHKANVKQKQLRKTESS